MIINGTSLIKSAPIKGMIADKRIFNGLSYGLTETGYDIRVKQSIVFFEMDRRFQLASSIEEFNMPNNLFGQVMNKSSWARRGLDASMTTNIEPGWKGFLTIELIYYGTEELFIPSGSPICSVIFHEIKEHVAYKGKYQNQPDKPVESINE